MVMGPGYADQRKKSKKMMEMGVGTAVTRIHIGDEHLAGIQICYHVGMLFHIRATGHSQVCHAQSGSCGSSTCLDFRQSPLPFECS